MDSASDLIHYSYMQFVKSSTGTSDTGHKRSNYTFKAEWCRALVPVIKNRNFSILTASLSIRGAMMWKD
ncbi:CLUMA_CG010609, isoform A [Clunio marinus]|uniref:CLUMA_CG010609, isoform A n=1 Tax=Clunio marinus TaxID=568069 RepID=A0A1J1ICD7_9DIPT|nr:CLUMA_CG010609, isoform A [Clunio marinus]